jgi:hypothetical protein
MIDQIGTTAGKIWFYLNENGETTISKLCRGLNETDRTILMGIGWLAREISSLSQYKDVIITLR